MFRDEAHHIGDALPVMRMRSLVEAGDVGVELLLKHIDGQIAVCLFVDDPAVYVAAVKKDGEHKPAVADCQGPGVLDISHFQIIGDTYNLVHTLTQKPVTVFQVGELAIDFQRVIVKHHTEVGF